MGRKGKQAGVKKVNYLRNYFQLKNGD